MSKLTGMLILDIFESTPRATIKGRAFYDLNELNYRRLQALALANPELKQLMEQSLLLERASETICLIPVEAVTALSEKLNAEA